MDRTRVGSGSGAERKRVGGVWVRRDGAETSSLTGVRTKHGNLDPIIVIIVPQGEWGGWWFPNISGKTVVSQSGQDHEWNPNDQEQDQPQQICVRKGDMEPSGHPFSWSHQKHNPKQDIGPDKIGGPVGDIYPFRVLEHPLSRPRLDPVDVGPVQQTYHPKQKHRDKTEQDPQQV